MVRAVPHQVSDQALRPHLVTLVRRRECSSGGSGTAGWARSVGRNWVVAPASTSEI
uniref:Uncharacterized protein n=1 Tax=Arundo donax TaxID=35708 RepID=A0A0A9CJI2_ARUDO